MAAAGRACSCGCSCPPNTASPSDTSAQRRGFRGLFMLACFLLLVGAGFMQVNLHITHTQHEDLPRIWWPSQEQPLPVHTVLEYHQSGNGGLNNLLYAVITAFAEGCLAAENELRERKERNPELPPSFAVVIVPPLRSELGGRRQRNVAMHMYSDLFDLDHQARLYMERQNCFPTDLRTFQSLKAQGALLVANETRWERKERRRGLPLREYRKPFYSGLEMSKALRERYYQPCVSKMHQVFHPGESHYTAVHMRVEDDWSDYCQRCEAGLRKHMAMGREVSPGLQGRYCFGAQEIANITLSIPGPNGFRNFLILYAADNFHPDWANRLDSMKADPMEVWPAGAFVAQPTRLRCFTEQNGGHGRPTYTERSVVSMFLAADAAAFVGSEKSSFFTGVRMIREQSRPPESARTYAYDVLG